MTDVSIDQSRAGAADSLAAPSTGTWRDYVTLLKPRVMTLVVLSGFAGLWIAPGPMHPVLAAVAVLCIAVGAGAAGAINMWYDRDIDAVMGRTKARPIVDGRVQPAEALAFGVVLTLGSVAVLGLAVNWVAAAILALASAFYVFVYTIWLKRRTPQNIVIGGAAGAFPPIIGWAAVTGEVGFASIVLFGLIFMWTPPHFWALALYRRKEYAEAGVPMLPVVAGERETKRQMLIYTVLLLPLAPLPWLLGVTGALYGVASVALGLAFLGLGLRVWREDGAATGHKAAKQMFGFSILYLFALFTLMIIDRAGPLPVAGG
ncbi:MAG: protoheme IX farnesyltransferase [Alphaproteobacteria bacterium]|jgi:protoheme IX farnesyltransferase|nr:protoheme IX farnesyltransferase [Alphaproteobacteria bacterium]